MRKVKKLIVILLIVSMLVSTASVFASAGSIAYGTASVTASVLNIRSSTSTSSRVIGTVSRDSMVIVLEQTTGSWYKINYNGTVGYVYASYLTNLATVQSFTATGKIAGNSVRMRDGASTSNTILGTYNYGTVMNVLGIENGWYKVEYNGVAGYVRSDLVTITGASCGASTPATETTTDTGSTGNTGDTGSSGDTDDTSTDSGYPTTGRIAYSYVNMRSGPSTSYTVLATYSLGTMLDVLGIDSGWYNVRYNGLTGYIRSDLLNLGGTSGSSGDLGEQIAEFALQFVGYNYVYGAESPSQGFDCSGLVYYVYNYFSSQTGFTVTRSARTQWESDGRTISKSELQPGDLVFFAANGSTVSHVGIYIGDGKFVHASSSTVGVIVSSLTSSNYVQKWLGAKTLVN